MIEAPISCVRMRDLARPPALCASRAERLTDATGIAESLGPRPEAASSRPGVGDLVASIIW